MPDPPPHEIIKALATKVMGWTCRSYGRWYSRNTAFDGAWDHEADEDWNPLTDPAASKQIRDRMFELGWDYRVDRTHRSAEDIQYRAEFWKPTEDGDLFFVDADTEGKATGLGALRAVEGK